jgi:DNA helicase-2/ATP-dependent DNA helicase PcrA
MFYADLHIHSKYSRACSRDCDLEHLAWWAARKGVSVLGTGDFTHPAWAAELRETLVPAEPGLFRLRPELERRVARTLPAGCRQAIRFLLSVEISTIYKRDDKTRKVHHLLYAPDFSAAESITNALSKIGNLASDGRPILGLDSRHLLEITLESDAGSYLIPAHAWTPWFSVLGSKSGFDAVADCYGDLAEHVFAVETGLSSDPEMNWRVGSLDRYRLVSNSDAHSPPALAREASAFDTPVDYYAIRAALETGAGYRGTVEFFPEEGKYHLDGHRKCSVRLDPAETRRLDGRCPECGRPLTVGVLNRVEELASYPTGRRPQGAAEYQNLVQLPQIVAEIRGVGPRSKTVLGEIGSLVAALGPELSILTDVPVDDIRRTGGGPLAEAIGRLRRGEVIRDAGYDGEYGVIRLFQPGELASAAMFDAPDALFDITAADAADTTDTSAGAATDTGTDTGAGTGAAEPAAAGVPGAEPSGHGGAEPGGPGASPEPGKGTPTLGAKPGPGRPRDADAHRPDRTLLGGLDPEQRAAATRQAGPLLIVAGPGTGKTRTLTHRIAHLVRERGIAPGKCLAITFTRRAAEEMRERLGELLPEHAAKITVTTFHGLGAMILREQHERAGLSPHFRIVEEKETAKTTESARAGEAAGQEPRDNGKDQNDGIDEKDTVDFQDLLELPVQLLTKEPDLAAGYRDRWQWISVDEYQDVDETQYALLRLLSAEDGNLTAIGDPDQAIYSFRGADVGFFLRFTSDFPGATTVQLTRNYRSSQTIVRGATQAIAPSSLVPGRALTAHRTLTARSTETAQRIGIFEAADPQAEADFIARSIDRLLGGTSFHSLDSGRADGHHHNIGFSDIAVLYRTDAQAGPIMESLTRAGVPYQKRSHDRLLARPGVKEIAGELRHHGAGPLAALLDRAMATLIATRFGREVELRSAVELLAPLAARCGTDLEAFLGRLALGAEVDAYDPRADSVALLTLHAAKGLEFPVVFLAGCENGLLPLWLPGDTDRDEPEERRLFFVGMTRARDRLHLSYARRRARFGAERDTGPSPFLRTLDTALTERLDAAGRPAARARPRDRQLKLL